MAKLNKKIKSFRKKLKNFDFSLFIRKNKKNYANFFRYNVQFISYVLLCLLSCSLLRTFTIGKFFDLGAIFFDLALILVFGAFAYLFKPRKQFPYFLTIMIVITIMNVINSVYYSFFNSYASFGLLASLSQTGEVTDAVYEKIKLTHLIYIILPVIYYFIHKYLVKKDYFSVVEKIEAGKKLFIEVLLFSGICLSINVAFLTGTDVSRFSKQWNREYNVERFGIIVYQLNDGVQTIINRLSSLFGYEEAVERFTTYFKENPYKHEENEYTDLFEGYNVVVMHLESIMSFLIDLKINGEEVTPNLNKLVKESMYFDNFYPQVSAGTSSDTEFTFSSSLMPVQSGTVFVSYYNRSYITLQNLLADKGYYTFSMHGNKASMWNRNKMHPKLGYMDFYSQDHYTIDEEVGLGLSDHSFFKQSESIIKDINTMVNDTDEYNNYMGTIITLSNHTPFMKDGIPFSNFDVTYHTGKKDILGNEIIYDYLEEKDLTMMGNYIKSVHYADKCLGEYLDYVRSNHEYDKTLFVLYGDHAAQLSRKEFGRFINYDFLTGEQREESDPKYVDYDYYENELFKKTPLILWTKDKKITGKISYPMGMIDCLPTLANMLGIVNKYQLGHDIFSIKDDNVVVFPNGNFLTNKVYYNNSKNETKIFFESEILDDDYIDKRRKYADEILTISNDIIVYNLIERVVNAESKVGGKI